MGQAEYGVILSGICVVLFGSIFLIYFGNWLNYSNKPPKLISFHFERSKHEPEDTVMEIEARTDAGFIANRLSLNKRTFLRFTNSDVRLLLITPSGTQQFIVHYTNVKVMHFTHRKSIENLHSAIFLLALALLYPLFPILPIDTIYVIGGCLVLSVFSLWRYYNTGLLTIEFSTKNLTGLRGAVMTTDSGSEHILSSFFHIHKLILNAHKLS